VVVLPTQEEEIVGLLTIQIMAVQEVVVVEITTTTVTEAEVIVHFVGLEGVSEETVDLGPVIHHQPVVIAA